MLTNSTSKTDSFVLNHFKLIGHELKIWARDGWGDQLTHHFDT